jgi:hypothetical protein
VIAVDGVETVVAAETGIAADEISSSNKISI